MRRHSIDSRKSKFVKRYRYLLFARNIFNAYGKQLLYIATKTGLDVLKDASKTAQSIKQLKQRVDLEERKIADNIVKPEALLNASCRNVEEIIIPSEKTEILNELRQVL